MAMYLISTPFLNTCHVLITKNQTLKIHLSYICLVLENFEKIYIRDRKLRGKIEENKNN